MANPYRALLSAPGVPAFVSAGFVGRMAMSMQGIATVLLVFSATGSYGTAGSVSATNAVGYAAASTLVGRMVDRHGQRRLLVPLVMVNAVGVALLICLVQFGAPVWTFFPAAATIGMSTPSLSAMVRARWSHLLSGDPRLHTAYSIESVADEVVFVTGPPLVTGLATLHPALGQGATGLLTFTGCLALAALRKTEPPLRPRPHGRAGSAIAMPGIQVLAGVFLLLGSLFGGVEVSALAFAQESGHRALAGVLLGCYAFGSGMAGLWYGARHWNAPLNRRFLIGLALLVAGVVPMTLISSLYVMIGVIFFSGLAIAPTIIDGYGIIERLVPAHLLTEGFTWLSTSVGIGVAVGASVAGRLVDAYGSGGAFLFPLCAGAVAVCVGLAGASRLRVCPGGTEA